MNRTKDIWTTGFALFSMFFGAGNLILPPLLGFKGQNQWFIIALGFSITAVIIPILAIYAHARLQGTLYDFGKKVSPIFSIIYCVLIYCIAIALPAPRTASVTHEMAIAPFFNSSTLLTSSVYFILVLVFVLNRSKILNLLGQFLTPLIVVLLLVIIGVGFCSEVPELKQGLFKAPLVDGILEGYQTFDAIGGVVVGAVLIVSLNLRKDVNFEIKKQLIIKSGLIAGVGLCIIYTGLIITGAHYNTFFDANIDRTALLSGLSLKILGNTGRLFLSMLVSLACFTTAVGIVTGTADYFKSLFKNSQLVYNCTAVIGCSIGIIVGSFNVEFIITLAVPALMFIYPITIILIILNCLPKKVTTSLVFRTVVCVTILFSITDFLSTIGYSEFVKPFVKIIPLAEHHLGWVLPALVSLVISTGVQYFRLKR